MSDTHQAICRTSGLRLWVNVNAAGYVTGVRGNELDRFPDLTGEAFPNGDPELPLYGDIPYYDTVTEVLSAPTYRIEADRVVRSYSVRPKTATEFLKEICWWFATVHSDRHASPVRII